MLRPLPKIGDMYVRATLQRDNGTTLASGEWQSDWVDVGKLWAQMQVRSITEEFKAYRQNQAQLTHLLTARFRSDIEPTMRIVLDEDGTVLQILGSADMWSSGRFIDILCAELA